MNRTLLVGIGNELRGDDAAGIVAAERIARRHPELACRTYQELPPELAELLGAYDTVLFLDASIEYPVVRIEELAAAPEILQSGTHSHTPASLLAIAAALYDAVPRRAILIHIPAESFDLGLKLSQRTAAAVDSTVRLADSILADVMACIDA